jgi:hypothetical protein
LSADLVIELNDSTINSRARLADALGLVIQADPRVRRWRRIEFADDGGALIVVDLHPDPRGIADLVIARELELVVAMALPKLPWVRVQVG